MLRGVPRRALVPARRGPRIGPGPLPGASPAPGPGHRLAPFRRSTREGIGFGWGSPLPSRWSDGMALHLQTAALVAVGSPLFTSAPHGTVRLSELVAVNDGEFLDEDGDDSDWIEVHNSGSTLADITGWFLTDDPGDLQKSPWTAATRGWRVALPRGHAAPTPQLHDRVVERRPGRRSAARQLQARPQGREFGAHRPGEHGGSRSGQHAVRAAVRRRLLGQDAEWSGRFQLLRRPTPGSENTYAPKQVK